MALWVYSGPMVENLLTKVYLDPVVYRGPGVYRGPPEVYHGPCMKNMALNTHIIFTDVKPELKLKTDCINDPSV